MFQLDHVAIAASDIRGTTKYYVETFGATVLYADDTWAFLQIGQGKVALVSPSQHPPHIALRVDLPTLEAAAAKAGMAISTHRDGTRGIYLKDPAGNNVELIWYPVDADKVTG
jgi:catechol 2,3-dioxygenase-like lactoylglutathione lyase family enzyme